MTPDQIAKAVEVGLERANVDWLDGDPLARLRKAMIAAIEEADGFAQPMPAQSMLERVADAIMAASYEPGYDRHALNVWQAKVAAQDAVAALREPTEEMKAAPGGAGLVSRGLAHDVWLAMIDAILPKEPVENEAGHQYGEPSPPKPSPQDFLRPGITHRVKIGDTIIVEAPNYPPPPAY